MKRFSLLPFSALVVAAANGQALITAGTSQFGWTSTSDANISGASIRTGTGGGASAIFTSQGSANQLFQQWMWFRVNGVDTREFALSALTGKVVSGNHMTLSYNETEGFTADVDYTITNQGSGTLLTKTVFITNVLTSGGQLNMSFFDYFDFDLNSTGNDDTATIASNNPALRVLIGDAGGPMGAEYRAIDGVNYQVGAFSGVRTLLTNTGIDNFNSTGAPFGPADFSAGNQWSFVLNPGQQIAIQTSMLLTPVPEPATLAALGLGAMALIRRRRTTR